MKTALELSGATGEAPHSIRAEFRQALFETARVKLDLRDVDAIEVELNMRFEVPLQMRSARGREARARIRPGQLGPTHPVHA